MGAFYRMMHDVQRIFSPALRSEAIVNSDYSTDGDATNRFFTSVPTQAIYRDLILTQHGILNAAHPRRYKRFIRSGDDEHTALQRPTFYLGADNGYPLWLWTGNFHVPTPFWIDIVEDFVPLP
jgi:hypothetical protein